MKQSHVQIKKKKEKDIQQEGKESKENKEMRLETGWKCSKERGKEGRRDDGKE